MTKKTLNITATEPQTAFLNLTCKYPLFVGGYGSGKTETMLNRAIMDASKHPKAMIALYAPTYDLVKLILAKRLEEKLIEHGIPYDYNKAENIIRTEHPQFGDFVLRSLDSPERIVGYESFRAHIDELDVLPLKQAQMAWSKILGRNRQKLPGVNEINKVSAYSTPEGYNFLYDKWVKNNPNPEQYKLIKAASETNPFLPEDYIQSLKDDYSPELAKAYLNGDFVNLTQGTVYNSFDRDVNGSNEIVEIYDQLYIGMDFNVTKMCATVYVSRKDGYHAVDEFSDLFDTPEMIDSIVERYGANRRVFVYPDASGTSRKTVGASENDILLLKKAGFQVRAKKKNPLVKDRVLASNLAFKQKKVYINATSCPNTVECLEQQAYDDNGKPDKKAGKDHQNDATTYFIVYQLPIKKRVFTPTTGYIK